MSVTRAPDGCLLHYDVHGAGDPVLLIPGLGGDARFWDGVVKRLADRFRLIAVDHRGAGRSGRPEQEYAIAQLAVDVCAVMDAEGIARAHVVGHSAGAAIAMCLSMDVPERVGRVALSGAWERPDTRFRELLETRLEVLLRAGPSCYQRLTHVFGYPGHYLEANAAALEKVVRQASHALDPVPVAAARIRMLLEHDRGDDLARIAHQTLVLAARDDTLVPYRHSEALAKLIPGATLVPMMGGHFFPKVNPAPYAMAVRNFLLDD